MRNASTRRIPSDTSKCWDSWNTKSTSAPSDRRERPPVLRGLMWAQASARASTSFALLIAYNRRVSKLRLHCKLHHPLKFVPIIKWPLAVIVSTRVTMSCCPNPRKAASQGPFLLWGLHTWSLYVFCFKFHFPNFLSNACFAYALNMWFSFAFLFFALILWRFCRPSMPSTWNAHPREYGKGSRSWYASSKLELIFL